MDRFASKTMEETGSRINDIFVKSLSDKQARRPLLKSMTALNKSILLHQKQSCIA